MSWGFLCKNFEKCSGGSKTIGQDEIQLGDQDLKIYIY